jgi:hypothetical protein
VVPGVEDTEVQYKIAIPSGFSRIGTDVDKQVGFIDAYRSSFMDPCPVYAFWLISNFFPAIQATNVSLFARLPRVWFEGYKYDIDEVAGQRKGDVSNNVLDGLKMGRIPSTRVTIGGVSAQSVSSTRLQA